MENLVRGFGINLRGKRTVSSMEAREP